MTETWLVISVIGGGLLLEGAARLHDRLHPPSYFEFEKLISGFDNDTGLLPLVLRLLAIALFGAFVGVVNPAAPVSAGAGAAIVAGLLAVWSPLVRPYLLPGAPSTVLQSMLLMFVLSSGFIGGAGAYFARTAFGVVGQRASGGAIDWVLDARAPTATDVLGNVLAGLVVFGAIALGERVLRSIRRRITWDG